MYETKEEVTKELKLMVYRLKVMRDNQQFIDCEDGAKHCVCNDFDGTIDVVEDLLSHIEAVAPVDNSFKLPAKYKNISVSHATLVSTDIVRAMYVFMAETFPILPKQIKNTWLDFHRLFNKACDDNDEEEREAILNWDIFNLFNDIAPEGCVFGASEGDGSDFGFWECEE